MHGNKTAKTNFIVPLVIIVAGLAIAVLLFLGENSATKLWWSYLLSFSIMLVFALSAFLFACLQRVAGGRNSKVVKGLEDKISKPEEMISNLEVRITRLEDRILRVDLERASSVSKSDNEKAASKPFAIPEFVPIQSHHIKATGSIHEPIQTPAEEPFLAPPIVVPNLYVPDNGLSPIARFVESYNAGTKAGQGRDDFYETYDPRRFANVYFLDHALGVEAPPKFDLQDDGDFFAVLIPGKYDDYWVVPRFAVCLNNDLYVFGAMGKVFECMGYEPGQKYTALSLIKPASFRKYGNEWSLVEKGVIDVTSDFGTREA